MYLLVIFLPFISFICAILFGKYLGRRATAFLTIILLFLTTLCAIVIFYEVVLCHSVCTIKLIPWIKSNFLVIYWGFLFDSLTATMLIVVTFISLLVHIYSVSYMEKDPHLQRFMSYLSLFTFFMLMLVTADNYAQMFLGWEGVGIASYLLINFWFTRIAANRAAMKAVIVNKIGDVAILLGLASIYATFNSFDYPVIFNLVPFFLDETFVFFGYSINKVTLISLFLFLGAVGKSAQIGLHTWLPDAMEGPTPVSALIHAATMVTAGVFVVLRSSPILEYSNTVLLLMTIVGSLTAFMAATIGIVQNDLKKVIAYSTCSQLGYMIFACGLSNYSVAIFHLMNHAFFKALLFLSAGCIIHAMSDEQDMRKFGGLIQLLPVTYLMVLIGSLALMGFPFLTGFYSKDFLLELSFGTYHISGIFAYSLGVLSAFCTAFYSVRLIILTFFGSPNSSKILLKEVHESSFWMLIPLVVLFFGSVFVGFLAKDLFLGLGTDVWNVSLFQKVTHISTFEAEFISYKVKLIPFIFSLFGMLSSLFIYKFANKPLTSLEVYKKIYYVYTFFSKKWYFDVIYNYFISRKILDYGYNVFFKLIDRGVVEVIGPFGIVRILSDFSTKISKMQSGQLYHYALFMIVGLISFLLLSSIDPLDNYILIIVYLFMAFQIFKNKL